MSFWSRIVNVIRGERLNREIDAELESHIEEAIEQGRDPIEARKALGPALRHREKSRDIKLIPWLDSLRADAIFGWRQIRKKKVTSAAAIVSLALAIGACTSAFRLIDALLIRPLPVAEPERLYVLSRQSIDSDGKPHIYQECEYPLFREMRAAVKDQAELIAISLAERMDVTYGSDQEMEKACLQYVSGWLFSSFGLRPALGRLLTENDDSKPGAHPYAVLSHDYWARRFGGDPKVIGRTFRMGNHLYEILGVTESPFTGTEPGTVVDIFVPTMMHRGVSRSDWSWFRTLAKLKPGVSAEPVRERLGVTLRAFQEGRAKGFTHMSKEKIDHFINEKALLDPAPAGVSTMQKDNFRSLSALGVLVGLVLLIACANVANLMAAKAAAQAREIALRVSIGAGRWRLVQLVMMESAWLACLAAMIGGLFTLWSTPFAASMINPPDNPARLSLPLDWRVIGFGMALTLAVTFMLSLAPALRASAVRPITALKGGEDPHSRRRLMHALIAAQVAFCFLVIFIASLFVATFERLSNRPTGFSTVRLLTLDTVTRTAQPPALWDQVAEHLRVIPGVETVALAGWPLLSGDRWNDPISFNGGPPSQETVLFLNVSPGWIDAMKIPLIGGRDFRASDTYPSSAIVNEAFAKRYFNSENPTGRSFEKLEGEGARTRFQIVGLVRDACYHNLREPATPTAYVPFRSIDAKGAFQAKDHGTFIVRTSGSNPLALASILRNEVPRARSEFRVSNIRTQKEINESHTVRERLLARLAIFFAAVALLLSGIGVYGVLHFSVLQRRREIGIRMALGARAADVAGRVTRDVFTMVLAGAVLGLGLGMASVRYIESLLYEVEATDLSMLAGPSLALFVVALLAALSPVIHAVRIDPVKMLRTE